MKKFFQILRFAFLSIYPISGLISEEEFEALGEPKKPSENKASEQETPPKVD